MANRAAQELEALLSLGSGPVDAGAELERLDAESEIDVPSGGSGKAKFATPEALATAVGASFILGPIGGLLLGAAQGIIGKQMRQGQLDAIAAEANALAEADELVASTFDAQRAGLSNPHDIQQLNTIQSQYDAARKLMQSPFEETKAKGMALMQQALEAQRAFDVRQEEQAIAAAQAEETALRELGAENYSRFRTSQGNFMKESAPYMEVRQATLNALNALDRGTPVDQYAAIKMLEKALDPGSIVRPAEQEAWGKLGSIYERANVLVNKMGKGESLSPSQVDQMIDLLGSIENESYKIQVERENRYSDELDDIFLGDAPTTDKYRNNFRLAAPLKHITLLSDEELETLDRGR